MVGDPHNTIAKQPHQPPLTGPMLTKAESRPERRVTRAKSSISWDGRFQVWSLLVPRPFATWSGPPLAWVPVYEDLS